MLSLVPNPQPSADDLPKSLADTALGQLHTQHHLLDDLDVDALAHRVNALLRLTDELGISPTSGLLNHTQRILLAGHPAASLTTFTTAAALDALHATHNTIVAYALAEAHRTGDTADLKAPKGVKLAARPGGKERPFSDDEILLLRLHTLNLMRDGRWTIACQLALVEAGALPSETTTVTPRDFNDLRHPTAVTVPGTKFVRGRTLTLPAWSRPIIAEGLNHHLARHSRAADSLLMYAGTRSAGGAAASATACGNLKRAIRAAGIPGQPPVPTSITRWRVIQITAQHGWHPGIDASGRRHEASFRVFTNLTRTPRTQQLATAGYCA